MKESSTEIQVCAYCTAEGVEGNHTSDNLIEVEALVFRSRPNHNLSDEMEQRLRNDYAYSDEQILYRRTEIYHDYESRLVCLDHLHTCEWCSEVYPVPNDSLDDQTGLPMERSTWGRSMERAEYDHQDELCRNCAGDAYTCNRCDELMNSDETRAVDGDYWCEGCTEDGATYCDNCDEYSRYDCGCRESQYIHDYSYKPDPIFQISGGSQVEYRRERVGTIFMGFELEVESNSGDRVDGSEYVHGKSNRERDFYLKSDGSLNDGFEIVSHPMTLARFQELDLSWMEGLTNQGFTSWSANTCGIHVHISRDAFKSPSHTYKFAQFIAMHKTEMTRLGGRDSDRWATFDGTDRKIMPYIKGQMHPHRYEAVNFCNNNTLELRFFKGSLRAKRLLSALELTHAVATYTGIIDSNDAINGALHWSPFASWVTEMASEDYPNLVHYITKFSL